MALFGSRVWPRCMYFILVIALPVPVGLGQVRGTDASEFTNIVIPTGGDPDAVAVADVNHDS
jgi:hypothetical protein